MFLENMDSISWLTNITIGLVWLVLITNWVTFLFSLLIGVSLGAFIHYLIEGPTHLDMEYLGGAFANYLWAVIIAAIFARRKEIIQKEKQQSLRMQAAAIAHEMRTPLAAVANMATGLKNYLPTLIETQQTMQEKEESLPYVNDKVLEPLKLVPIELERVARSAFTVIDTLLLNLQDAPSKIVLERCNILDCVEAALKAYSLTDAEEELISLENVNNFEVETNAHLLKHVFFNLLKNSLHYLKAAGKGKILIWTEKGEKFNKLHFKDTGKGIPPNILPHIFDQFYSRTDHGTGVGLAFCKMVMQRSGGDITCESIEGEFTHFILSFPLVK
ncbi:sensor histidine kinase [Candidatus Odyssella thessalonicensis]|uniref:sensor histidine kinase n=1 Tax=Candidatus Odyssella thessalonicensis TaxID=84647 RepID=UPI001FE1DEEF|nr:HAMP domain-containing sensor histidine kinase [Candidatus Odyssella thessalonicensis]